MNRSLKVLVCAALLGFATATAPAPVTAAECGGQSMAAQILKNHQDKLKALGCKKDADCIAKRNEIVENAKTFWNSMAGNSWATLGPRDLELGKDLKGTVVNPGERRFINAVPVIDYDNMTVTITKTGGKAETGIQISKLDAQGNCTDLVTETVPAGDGAYKKTFSLSAVRGSVITVRLTPKGLGRKLEYTLRADGK
ncbi:MAG: hypothetical protein IPK82_21985 [Polyangiaceae bacterium]|nr:hypothetical protein [Polyangiaceae bacterium]